MHDQTMESDEPQPRDDDAATGLSWQGQVLHVSGRGSDDSRGLPPVHEITLSRGGGSDLVFGPIRNDDAKDVRVRVLGAPEFHNPERCPICGAADDLTREHVPQGDLGGRVMTLTCRTCNNRLGSRVEGELKDWFDDAIGSVRFSGGDIPGRRRAPRILLRTTAEGEVGMFFDTGKSDADIGTMLASGQAEMHYRIPIPKVWRMAALKHAYLGACLGAGGDPRQPNGPTGTGGPGGGSRLQGGRAPSREPDRRTAAGRSVVPSRSGADRRAGGACG